MEQAKIERALRLIKLLISNINYSIDELASNLEISRRTLFRYLATLEQAGFIVYRKPYIQLGKESPFLKDISQLIHFTKEEAYMVHQLIESIEETNLVKRNLKRKLASVYNYRGIADSIVKGERLLNIHRIQEAIEEKKQVIFHDYSSANGGEIKNRFVEPYAFTTDYIQVWCYDIESKCCKMFKTSRIKRVEVLDNNWLYENEHQEYFMDVFRMSSTNKTRYPIKLLLNIRAYDLLIEEFPLAEKQIEKISNNKWLFKTEVCDFASVGRFVIGLSADIEIIDTPLLANYIREYVDKHIIAIKKYLAE